MRSGIPLHGRASLVSLVPALGCAAPVLGSALRCAAPVLGCAALVLGSALGCAAPGRAAAPPPPAVAPAVPVAREESDLIAQEAMDARVTMTLRLDRVARFRFARHLVRLGGWGEALAGTGVDPLRDVRRAFLAAPTSHLGRAMIVLHHTADEARVAGALAELQRTFRAAHSAPRPQASPPGSRDGEDVFHTRRDGEDVFRTRRDGVEDRIAHLLARYPDPSRYPFPAAYRVLRGGSSRGGAVVLVAAPRPGLLVVLPPERVLAAFRLMEVTGLRAPSSGEVMVIRAWDPRRSIQDIPVWSREVRYAEATLAFDDAGDGTLRFRAVCSSPEAARAQARELTTQVDRAQTVSFAGADVRLFDAIEFHAEDDRVKMRTRLLAQDVDWLVTMTMKRM